MSVEVAIANLRPAQNGGQTTINQHGNRSIIVWFAGRRQKEEMRMGLADNWLRPSKDDENESPESCGASWRVEPLGVSCSTVTALGHGATLGRV